MYVPGEAAVAVTIVEDLAATAGSAGPAGEAAAAPETEGLATDQILETGNPPGGTGPGALTEEGLDQRAAADQDKPF